MKFASACVSQRILINKDSPTPPAGARGIASIVRAATRETRVALRNLNSEVSLGRIGG